MSPTEPRSEQEIRADLAQRLASEGARQRLIFDVAPLLDALSAALAAKEAAEHVVASQLGECEGCTDEPLEFCPHHGRSYGNLLAYLDEVAGQRGEIQSHADEMIAGWQARAERAEARNGEVGAAVRRALSQHPYNEGCTQNYVTDQTYCCVWHLLRAALAAVSPPEPTPEEAHERQA